MTIVKAHGISVDAYAGWDVSIRKRAASDEMVPDTVSGRFAGTPMSGFTFPVLHLANFPLPPVRGDYGSGAVDVMNDGSILICLLEFGPESTNTAMFPEGPLPALVARDFAKSKVQRPAGNIAGTQAFRTIGGRAFSLYVVIGNIARREQLVPFASAAVSRITVEPNG